jgi:hypothetical protein
MLGCANANCGIYHCLHLNLASIVTQWLSLTTILGHELRDHQHRRAVTLMIVVDRVVVIEPMLRAKKLILGGLLGTILERRPPRHVARSRRPVSPRRTPQATGRALWNFCGRSFCIIPMPIESPLSSSLQKHLYAIFDARRPIEAF